MYMNMEPFKEFDEPAETLVTPLNDGSFLIESKNRPPVPWRTGFFDYGKVDEARRESFSIFWRIDKLMGLDMLAATIMQFEEDYAIELQEAALDRELGGREKWPVEQQLDSMKTLHSGFVAIYECNDPRFNTEPKQ